MIQVLLIEDEESIRRVMSRILKEENDQYKITEAVDGKQGLDLLFKMKNLHLVLKKFYSKMDQKRLLLVKE